MRKKIQIAIALTMFSLGILIFVLNILNTAPQNKDIPQEKLSSIETFSTSTEKTVVKKITSENNNVIERQEENETFNKAVLQIIDKKYDLLFKDGENIFDGMKRLRDLNQIDFNSIYYSGLGELIDSINGVKSSGKETWIYYINDKEADVGVSAYKLQKGDVILWKLEKSIN